MTRFSGTILLPSRTLQYLCEAANEHGLTVQRHAELCIIAATRIIDRIEPRILSLPPLRAKLAAEVSINVPESVLQIIASHASDAGMKINAYCRSILILAVDGMAKADMPTPKRPDPMPSFRTYRAARVIHEQMIGYGAAYSHGDPPPGRSALDCKRNLTQSR